MNINAMPVRPKQFEHQDQDIDKEEEESLLYLIPRNLS